MLNLTVNCLGRGLLAGFPFAGTSILAGRFVAEESVSLHKFLKKLAITELNWLSTGPIGEVSLLWMIT
jgi:hypothetical protein